ITGIEEAQKKLAQDLHDEFGQTLAALHMGVETLWNSIPDEMGDQKNSINELIGLIEQLGDKIRSISSDLRPDLLDDLGLAPTLEWYIKEFQEQRTDLKIDFQAVGFKKRATPEIELVLYRIFQESLTNIVKHAKARQVTVMLTFNYPKVILMVKDDGVGFDPTQRYGGIGLIGMRERAVSVGGFIDIRSEKGKGTTIRVEMPVS
ncbi:MAG: sensor histidine kinase, partial [Thermodesulfobacteriota bacterium]